MGSTEALTANDVPVVLQCLQGALSPDSSVQKQAEAYLNSLEHRPGFCSCLAEIIANKDNDHSARWLASVHFKNSIIRHWRGRSFSNEEKAHIRQRLNGLISQDDNQIAVQLALVYAKIARLDFPSQWPTLFSDLLSGLGQPNVPTLTIRRIYLILHHVLKELSSKRLAADTRSFAEVASLLFPHVWGQWCGDTQALLAGIPQAAAPSAQGMGSTPATQQPLMLTFERWILLLKILRRLILFGHTSDARSMQPVEAVSVCAPPMVQALTQLVSMRPLLRGTGAAGQQQGGHLRSQLAAMLDRGVLKLTKTQCQVQKEHPWSYHAAGALIPMLSFCCDQVVSSRDPTTRPSGSASAFNRYLIQCMAFIVGVVKCGPYLGKTVTGDSVSDDVQDTPLRVLSSGVQAALGPFWSAPDRLLGLTSALMEGYLVLTAHDLEEWESNGEEYYHASDGSTWPEHLGSAAEVLLLTLLGTHKEALAPRVIEALQRASAACPPGADLANLPGPRMPGASMGGQQVPVALLLKEATYAAVAVGAHELHEAVDFPAWLRSALLPELGSQGPLGRILRRRAMRVITAWAGSVPAEERGPLYVALYQSLGDEDTCIQLTAVSTLAALLDDWAFEEKAFAEFVGPVLGQIMTRVLKDTKELDSHTQAFNLMNLIIERMGDLIKPHVTQILHLLPGLWKAAEAEGQSLVRMQILLALQRLVNALGPDSPAAYPIVLPILQYSVDLDQPEAVQLLEDGLGLWLVAVRNATTLQPALLGLTPHMARIMAMSSEHIQHCAALLGSCALMGRDAYVAQYHAELCSIFTGGLGNLNELGTLLLLGSMERLLAAAPSTGPQALRPALLRLLGLVLGKGEETGLTIATGCAVLARLLLAGPQPLLDLLENAAAQGLSVSHKPGWPEGLAPAEMLLAGLVETWCEHFDVLAQPKQRKLCALAMCTLLPLRSAVPLAFLDVLLGCITGVWFEAEGGQDIMAGSQDSAAGATTAAIFAGDDSGFEAELSSAALSEDATGETERRAQLRESDLVAQLRVGQQLRGALAEAERAHGPALQAALGRLDPVLQGQVRSACGLPPVS